MNLLRDWRKSQNLKQGEAAEKLGLNLRTYGAYERGEINPSQGPRTLMDDRTNGEVPADSWG